MNEIRLPSSVRSSSRFRTDCSSLGASRTGATLNFICGAAISHRGPNYDHETTCPRRPVHRLSHILPRVLRSALPLGAIGRGRGCVRRARATVGARRGRAARRRAAAAVSAVSADATSGRRRRVFGVVLLPPQQLRSNRYCITFTGFQMH
ncbi:hypothetical protein EVAR_99842_1 [Eumeta japonica]|uniref:Uncharacterized protein n=1 Tax=Eumeta variegata TaxID=151549 RepID=A0A4C1ZG85_EUMVA|nr:hypothetical protein EVAR_99842_1 [Eumeta japonica]